MERLRNGECRERLAASVEAAKKLAVLAPLRVIEHDERALRAMVNENVSMRLSPDSIVFVALCGSTLRLSGWFVANPPQSISPRKDRQDWPSWTAAEIISCWRSSLSHERSAEHVNHVSWLCPQRWDVRDG